MAKEKKDALDDNKKEKKARKDTKETTEKSSKKDKPNKKAQKDKPDKKDKKDKSEKGGVIKWFKDLKIEFHNVTWPSKSTVATNSGIVLGTIILASVFVGLLDSGLYALLKLLLGLAQNQ